MNNTEMETAASGMIDVERENTGEVNNLQTTFKQGAGVIKLFTFKLQRLLHYY